MITSWSFLGQGLYLVPAFRLKVDTKVKSHKATVVEWRKFIQLGI